MRIQGMREKGRQKPAPAQELWWFIVDFFETMDPSDSLDVSSINLDMDPVDIKVSLNLLQARGYIEINEKDGTINITEKGVNVATSMTMVRWMLQEH